MCKGSTTRSFNTRYHYRLSNFNRRNTAHAGNCARRETCAEREPEVLRQGKVQRGRSAPQKDLGFREVAP